MIRNLIKIQIRLLKTVLLLNLVVIGIGQSIDVSINLQEKEYKKIDLSDYFGVIINSFIVQNQQNVGGVSIVSPVAFLDKSMSSSDLVVRDTFTIYQLSQTESLQLSAKISLDKSSTTICELFLDSITNIQRTISITQKASIVLTDVERGKMNNISIQIIFSDQNNAFLLCSSIEKTSFYTISISQSTLNLTLKAIDAILQNVKYLLYYPYQIGQSKYFTGILANSIVTAKYDGQSMNFFSIINNPCGQYNQQMKYIQSDAFYLVKCVQNNGQQFFSAVVSNLFYDPPSIQQIKGSYLDYTLQSTIQTKTSITTINSSLVYVLEQSSNSSVNTMLLHKITFLQTNLELSVETIIFDTIVSDTEIMGSFIVYDDLIAVVTKQYILGFSVSKKKLLFRMKSQEIPNLTLIEVGQRFSTLLFTYQQNTDPIAYITHEFALSMPNLLIDFSQVQTTPLKFSVREQENPFNQIVNFTVNTLSTTETTTSIVQNKSNMYTVVETNKGIILNNNIEKYIVGSDLQLQLNDFQSETIKISSSLSSEQQYDIIFDQEINKSQIVKINPTYLDNIFIIVTRQPTQVNIFLVMLQNTGVFAAIDVQSFTVIETDTTNVSFDSFGSVYAYGNVIIPVYTSLGRWYLFKLQGILQQQLFNTDPFNNYIMIYNAQTINVIKYEIIDISKTNPIKAVTVGTINLPNIVSMQCNPSTNTLYYTDNSSIYSYNYQEQYLGEIIVIPDSDQIIKVSLLLTTFIVARKNANGQNEISVYSYNDQISFTNLKTTPIYLRQLIGLTYTLEIGNGDQIQTSVSVQHSEEYIAIPATNSQKEKVFVIFRLNEVTSQNQLYCSIPMQPTSDYFSFFGRNAIGQFNIKNPNNMVVYSFSYFIRITLNYSITADNYNSKFLYTAASQVQVATNLNNQSNDPLSVQFNLSIQKNLESQYGSVNSQSNGVTQLLNYYDSQPLGQNILFTFDDTGAYNANILGWQVSYSVVQLDMRIYTTSRLINNSLNGMNAYDVIQFGDNIVKILQNYLIFSNGKQIILGDDLDFCYLQQDESSIVITQDTTTKLDIIEMTLYTLCTNVKDSQIQQFNQIKIKQTQQPNNQPYLIEEVQNDKWTSTTKQFDRTLQTLIKISNDPNLGIIAGIQSAGQVQFSICQVNIPQQGSFTIDCEAYDTLKFLRVVYFMWSSQSKSNIFFSIDGLAYYQLTKTFDKFQVIDIKKILIDANKNIDNDCQVIGAQQLNNSQTVMVIGFDNGSIFQINLIFDDKNIFTQLLAIQYFSEPNYIFSGFASLSQDKSQTILAMYDIQNNSNLVFFYYKSVVEPYIIRSSSIQTLVNPLSLNGQMKIFYIGDSCYFFLNQRGDELSTVSQLSYSNGYGIIVSSFNQTNSFDSIGFYLSPIGVQSTKQTTIPIQVKIQQVIDTTYSSLLKLILMLQIIVFLLI